MGAFSRLPAQIQFLFHIFESSLAGICEGVVEVKDIRVKLTDTLMKISKFLGMAINLAYMGEGYHCNGGCLLNFKHCVVALKLRECETC